MSATKLDLLNDFQGVSVHSVDIGLDGRTD